MIGSTFAALFLALTCLLSLTGCYYVRKSANPLAGLTWIGTSVIGLTCWHTLVAAIANSGHVPVNAWSIGAADLVLGGALWIVILRQKAVQRYNYHAGDAILAVGLVVFVGWFFVVHTGGTQFQINYATVDPAPRLIEAINVVNTQTVESMFYHALTNGLLMDMLGPLTSLDYYYKIFVFSDGLFLVMAGLMFYATVRRLLRNPLMIVVGVVATFVYLGAYPLNSTLMGFVYLGMSVVIICYLVVVHDAMTHDEIGLWPAAVLLMLGCMGLILCYAMFAPFVFVALVILLWIKQRQRCRLFTVETVLVCLLVFVPAVIFGIIYTYSDIFSDGMTVGSAIAAEGSSYRDLFSNFVWWTPLAVFGFLKLVRRQAVSAPVVLLPATLLFVAGLFVMVLLNLASAYYYFKTYNVIWFLVIYLAVAGIFAIATRETAVLVGMFGIVWALVLGFALSGLDVKLFKDHPLFNPTAKANAFCDVYVKNQSLLHSSGGPTADQMVIYHYVFDNLGKPGDPPIPIVSYWEDAYWYQAISNQRDGSWQAGKWNQKTMTLPDSVMDMVNASSSPYLVVLTGQGSVGYEANHEFFDSLPRLFENNAGFVAWRG